MDNNTNELAEILLEMDSVSALIEYCHSHGIDIERAMVDCWFSIDELLNIWKTNLADNEWMNVVYDIQSCTGLSYDSDWVYFRNDTQSEGLVDDDPYSVGLLVSRMQQLGLLAE